MDSGSNQNQGGCNCSRTLRSTRHFGTSMDSTGSGEARQGTIAKITGSPPTSCIKPNLSEGLVSESQNLHSRDHQWFGKESIISRLSLCNWARPITVFGLLSLNSRSKLRHGTFSYHGGLGCFTDQHTPPALSRVSRLARLRNLSLTEYLIRCRRILGMRGQVP